MFIVGGFICQRKAYIDWREYLRYLGLHFQYQRRWVLPLGRGREPVDFDRDLLFQLGCYVHSSGAHQLEIGLGDIQHPVEVQVSQEHRKVVCLEIAEEYTYRLRKKA